MHFCEIVKVKFYDGMCLVKTSIYMLQFHHYYWGQYNTTLLLPGVLCHCLLVPADVMQPTVQQHNRPYL